MNKSYKSVLREAQKANTEFKKAMKETKKTGIRTPELEELHKKVVTCRENLVKEISLIAS